MSSFLAVTLATFAQPTPFEGRPSEKKRSTTGLAKLWIATRANIPHQGIHGNGIERLPELTLHGDAALSGGGLGTATVRVPEVLRR